MKIEDFKLAEGKVKAVEAISAILNRHTLGQVNAIYEYSSDFNGAMFFNIKNTPSESNRGIKISEHSDGSGAAYKLTKPDILKLQKFVKSMLDNRMQELNQEIKAIGGNGK